jgi:diguanylate cyclase (GGDEF)-like protein/PAS domain S-box-containing protein
MSAPDSPLEQGSGRPWTEALLEALPVAAAVFDAEGHVLAANTALCTLLHYAHQELVGLTSVDLLDSSDRDQALMVRNGERPRVGELTRFQRQLRNAEGQRVHCDVHSSFQEGKNGQPLWVTVLVDVSQRQHDTAELRYETTHDELTGLLNRKGSRLLLERLLAEPEGPELAVLFCDLDNFKRVNDALGHDVGDELLVALADRLTTGLPESCSVARHSGDEFVIVCADLSACGGLDALTAHLLRLLHTTVSLRGYLIGVSASIGSAVVGHDGPTASDLLRYADTAMYRAKHEGPGQIVRADATLLRSVEQELTLEGDLRRALDRDQLALYYQPIVDLAGQVIAAEALLRWPHPERGLLRPDVILPVAGQANLLRDLDLWVLHTATRHATGWPHTPVGTPVGVAVNLGSQFPQQRDALSTITEALTRSGLAAEQLMLEISETSLLDLAGETRRDLATLTERGAQVAIDDFGTGHASLGRLKDLPADVIKLDRGFVADLETDPVDVAIAQAAVHIANAKGSVSCAEGVETTHQLHHLVRLGYRAFQGFLFSPPVPEDQLSALITDPPTHQAPHPRKSRPHE